METCWTQYFSSDASPVWRAIEFGLELLKKVSYGMWEKEEVSKYNETSGYQEERDL